MKRAQRKDFFREIRKSLNRYLSILFIVALGVAFYAGIRSSEPDMRLSADAYFDQSRLMDVRVLGTLGMSEENVAAIEAVDGIAKAEGGYSMDFLSKSEDIVYTLNVFSLCEDMNQMTVKEGRLPEKPEECFVDEALMRSMGLSVGDRIVLRSGTEDELEDSLTRADFTIVGSGSYSWFLNLDRGTTSIGDGDIDGFIAVLPEAFSLEYYTVVYARADGLTEEVSYTDGYKDRMELILDQIEEIAGDQCQIHFSTIKGEAQEKIDEGVLELEDAKKEADEKLSDAAGDIADAEKELEDGRKKLEDARAQLEDGKKEIADGKQELADAKAELTEKSQDLQDGKAKLPEAEQKLIDGRKELEDGREEFAAGMVQWQEGRRQTDDGWHEYNKGVSELEKAEELLKTKEEELNQAEELLKGQETQLAEQEAVLCQSQSQLDEQRAGLEQEERALAEQKAGLEQQIAMLKAQLEAMDGAGSDAETDGDTDEGTDSDADAETNGDGDAGTDAGIDSDADAETSGDGDAGTDSDADAETSGDGETGTDAGTDSDAEIRTDAGIDSDAIEGTDNDMSAGADTKAANGTVSADVDAGNADTDGDQNTYAGPNSGEEAREELIRLLAEAEAGLEMVTAGQMQLEAGKEQLEEAQAQLTAGQEQLTAGRMQLEEAKTQTTQGREQIARGWQEIEVNREKLDRAKIQLEDAEKELADSWTSIGVAAWTLEHGEQELADGEQALADARAEIADGERQIAEGWDTIAENERKLADAERELPEAESEIAQAYEDIADGERKLEDGKKEYEEGKQEAEDKIRDAEEELADAQKTLDDLEEPEWFVLDRNSIQSYVEYGMDAQRIGAIGKVFPAIFFLVAALVSLTTMTRMVEEERTLIGTMKALGYGKWSIASKYILYALSASLLGSLLGVVVGSRLLPWVIMTAYGILYNNLQIMVMPINFRLSLMATAIAVACTTLAAFAACYKELRSEPAQLMRPAAPTKGKRVFLEYIPFVWRRMTFTGKSTIRNLFRYKKRFLMTIFGIGSCMALLMVGYGLRDSIQDIVDNQYRTLWIYDVALSIDDEESPEKQKENLEQLQEHFPEAEQALFARVTALDVGRGDTEKSAYLFVPQTLEELDQFVVLKNRLTEERYGLTDDGAVISEKLSKLLDVQVGDEIYLKEGETNRYPVKVTAISENYLSHYIYLTPTLYERLIGETPAYNQLYLKLPDIPEQAEASLTERLLKEDMVESVQLAGELQRTVQDMLKSLDMVIWVLIISAGLLAFVVLYNLNNINITERRRELATLKVLGFYDGEVAAYVYRENIYLTVIGIGVGVVLGIILHRYVILTCEIDMMMFGRSIWPMSYVYSMLITALFSLLVNIAMFYRLRKIDMVESLKSVE